VPSEYLGIIDTAIKIGLGALISGIATYQVTKIKSDQEKEKESKIVHREMLLKAVENIDEYFQFMSNYFAKLSGLKQSLNGADLDDDFLKKVQKFLEKDEADLVNARNCVYVAKTRLQLLSMTEALSSLTKIRALEKSLRGFYLDPNKKELPTDEFLSVWATNFIKYQDDFNSKVSTYFLTKCS
jgi:hypothetical protein